MKSLITKNKNNILEKFTKKRRNILNYLTVKNKFRRPEQLGLTRYHADYQNIDFSIPYV